MKTKLLGQAAGWMFAAVIFSAVALPANALTVSYTVDGVGPVSYPSSIPVPNDTNIAPWGVNGYPGDTVALQSYTGTLDLTPGTSIQQVNTLLWAIDYTWGGGTSAETWLNPSFSINANRNITIDTVTGSLSQTGSLDTLWDNDYLAFLAGPTLTLTVDGYNVAITLLAVPSTGGSNFDGSNPWTQPPQDMFAQFDISVAQTPLPAALPLFASGLGALGLFSWRRKRKAAALAAA